MAEFKYLKNTNQEEREIKLGLSCQEGRLGIVDFLLSLGVCVDGEKRTALMLSAIGGHDNIVELVLKHGSDVNVCDDYEKTALMYACSNGNYKIVEMLLEKGADVGLSDSDDKTALMMACEKGNARIVELLISKEAAVDAKDLTKNSALMYACENGHEKAVEVLVNHGVEMNDANYNRSTALTTACGKGHVNIVRLLTKGGADVNKPARYDTPLITTCIQGNEEILKLLLDHGANVNQAGWRKKTALIEACQKGRVGIVKKLIELGADVNAISEYSKTALIEASAAGQSEIVELLAKQDVDFEYSDDRGTPMAIACMKGHEKAAGCLIRSGADVHWVVHRSRTTALMEECRHGHAENVELLLERWVGLNTRDRNQQTALMHAAEKGDATIVEMLVKRGASLNMKDDSGSTALSKACANRHEEVVKVLLDHGVDPNASSDKRGGTALIEACRRGCDKAVELLLQKEGVAVNAIDDYESFALSVCKSERAMELLVRYGADVNMLGEAGMTPAMTAVYMGRHKCLKKLLQGKPNLDCVASDGSTVVTYALRKEDSHCLRVLLKDKNVLTDGRLKCVHRDVIVREIDRERFCLKPLLSTIKFGVFEWEMCPIEHFKSLSEAAVKYGIQPGKMNYEDEKTSPLVVAFLEGETELIKMFLENRYYLDDDYLTLTTDEDIRERIEDSDLLDSFTRQPMSH